jgi:hypothetical protein
MRRILISLAASLAASCESVDDLDQAVNAAPVVAVERAFATRAWAVGWVSAFRQYAAADAIMPGAAGYENAEALLSQTPDDGNRALMWWPAFAGISQSGDIGFTTGPVAFDETRTPRGYYFTIWRRQDDGAWRWIYDGGPGRVADPASIVPGEEPLVLGAGIAGVGQQRAIEQVSAIESRADLLQFLAHDAHVYRAGKARGTGGEQAAANFGDPEAQTRIVSRIEASAAGDLVFVLGEAEWVQDGREQRGFFARVWQLRAEGWRIVYDQMIVRRPPA